MEEWHEERQKLIEELDSADEIHSPHEFAHKKRALQVVHELISFLQFSRDARI